MSMVRNRVSGGGLDEDSPQRATFRNGKGGGLSKMLRRNMMEILYNNKGIDEILF